MDDWPFDVDGKLILSPAAQRVITELRARRDGGQEMKRIVLWARDQHGIEITAAGLWRLLHMLKAQDYQAKPGRKPLTLRLVRDPPC